MKSVYPGFASTLVLSALLLAGCGGGGGGGSSSGATSGASSGILTDAPVAGVAYTTSSGVTGTTGADGSYDFNAGDTVTFTLGGLTLGTVDATGIVSPLELANGDANVLQNLLVLLQSLDEDSDPTNGIAISTAAAAAVTTAIDLTADTATFASSANTGLQAAMDAGGITTPIVSTSDANAHFLEQGMTLLSSNIWVFQTGMIRFNASGEYLEGEVGVDAYGGTAGAEYGSAALTLFDVNGYKIVPNTPSVDTNGHWGLSDMLPCDRWRSVGDQIVMSEDRTEPVTDCGNSQVLDTFNKPDNDPTGIVGVWALGSATTINTQHFMFRSDGTFLMVDPLGDTQGNNCGGPGVEAGTYTYNATTGVLKVTGYTYDTNGCAGFSETTAVTADGMSFTIDGSTGMSNDGVDTFTMYRVSN